MTQLSLNIKNLSQYIDNISLISILDIIIVVFIVWQVLTLLSKSRGIQIAKGLFFLYIFNIIFTMFKLTLSSELFETLSTFLFLSLPVVFQREIRTTLEYFGRLDIFQKDYKGSDNTIREISKAVYKFASKKVGALIILERTTSLDEYTIAGTKLDSDVSSDVLECIFENQSVLHDGAVILRGDKIVAAKCILPLSDSLDNNMNFGTRHRAAIGMSEISDCIAIVVSEEAGTISLANKGLIKVLNKDEVFEEELIKIYDIQEQKVSKVKKMLNRK